MRRLDSLIMAAALATRVPGGQGVGGGPGSLRDDITGPLKPSRLLTSSGKKLRPRSRRPTTIIATGPLTSDSLAAALGRLTGQNHLHFYRAIAPIVTAESLDMQKIFRASRYGAGDDYLNCPFSEAEYAAFYEALTQRRADAPEIV